MADFPGLDSPYGVSFSAHATHGSAFVPYRVQFGFLGVGDTDPELVLTFLDPIPPDLPSPGRALLFNVTGVSTRGVTIVAEYNTGAYEVVHDGSEFSQVYAAQSVRTAIVGGFQYLVKRAGGWFGDSVTIRTIAASASGA